MMAHFKILLRACINVIPSIEWLAKCSTESVCKRRLVCACCPHTTRHTFFLVMGLKSNFCFFVFVSFSLYQCNVISCFE